MGGTRRCACGTKEVADVVKGAEAEESAEGEMKGENELVTAEEEEEEEEEDVVGESCNAWRSKEIR